MIYYNKLWVVIIVLNTFLTCDLIVRGNYQNYSQPQIFVMNGHMVIQAADDKNLVLTTSQSGKLFMNGKDITSAIKGVGEVQTTLDGFEANIRDLSSKLSVAVNGVDLLYNRVALIEKGKGNASIGIPTRQAPNILRLNRRLTFIQRKLRTLTNLLTQNECVSNPCQNGAVCFDIFNGFLCQCPENWEGPRCEKDVNECARFAHTDLGCQNGATCINRIGSYECVCASGWLGLHCMRRTAECSTGSNVDLCGHGKCISHNSGPGYTCLCDQGWTTDRNGLACLVDVDECSSNRPPCSTSPIVQCINLPGSFYCGNCPVGYTGNGYYCTDIDECTNLNGGCSTNPYVQCINTPGSRMCGLCPPGYQGNGESCVYQGNVCAINNGGCHPLASCQANSRISSSFVECLCPVGYHGSGKGPMGCVLTPTLPTACYPNPCQHGTCILNNATTDGFKCECANRFTGKFCDQRPNGCDSNPCQNGGTCLSISFSYFLCRCPLGFVGRTCQVQGQICSGTLSSESGELSYPPENSTSLGVFRHSCGWIVVTNTTKVLAIQFRKFNLPANCQNNFLQIHDGRNTATNILGRYCDVSPPSNSTIMSTSNYMYFWYRSEATNNNQGFSLVWNSTDPVCGETLSAISHGTIKSPGSPGRYPSNRDCYWRITAPVGKRLEFHFYSLIFGGSSDCTHDYLEFYQGLATTDSKFARYCNTSHPEPLVSPGPEVSIHFHSDSIEDDHNAGFQISYSVIGGLPGCGGVYTRDDGSITSPVIFGNYPENSLCEFKIQLRAESKIRFTFLSFALENSADCLIDYLAIYQGSSVDSPLIGKFCGSVLPSTFTAIGNQFLIVYKTDWTMGDKNFKLIYDVVCGGMYSASNGLIQYVEPHFEDTYHHQECIYEIIEPPGSIISLTVNNFVISTIDNNCKTEYLEIRDGDNANSTLIGRYCDNKMSTQIPEIMSTQNYLWIKFVAAMGSSFSANYSMNNIGCGGILKSKLGTIQSQEHLDTYNSSLRCIWVLIAPSGYVIQLTWVTFNVEISANCAYDRVEVYDNNTTPGLGGSMGTYCGITIPPTLISSANVMTIKFLTDTSVNLDGFLATYVFMKDTSVCGGNFFTNAGIITSPNYPNSYPPHKTCTWIISVQPGEQLLLNVTKFDIESYSNCRYDYLEIRNGGTPSSPLIGKYCGKLIPKTIPSHANKVYLQFVSDMTNTGPGFAIRWQSTATGCGGTLNSPVGSIISPHYPEPYSFNTECFWKISTSAGSVIQVIFADLDLEPHVTCFLDYVEIFDGFDATSKSLGKYCSAAKPTILKSTKNHITVKFRSDISFQGRGFNLQYSTVCNTKLSGFRGVIESPNFPNGYPQDLDCLWEIGVPEGNAINITFSHFELERTNNGPINGCIYDYLQIKYQNDDDNEIINYGTYCGENHPPDITIKSNLTLVHFVTDNLLKGSGFRLEWLLVGCGGTLNHPNGSIQTPNYPSGYPKSTICDWIIQTDYGTSIEMTFNDILMEMDQFCSYDSITIYNGPDDSYPLITTLCHKNTKPIVVTSTGNKMFVRFKSDSSYHGRGFTASYTTISTKCGGKLSAPSGSFSSPNYPQNFDKNDTCAWLIEVAENHRIELDIVDLDFIKSKDCERYYVQIHDGPTAAYPSLGKLCGNQRPNNTFVSSYNNMYLEMVSHYLITSKGFLANYSTACGIRIETQSSGLIEFNPHSTTTTNIMACSWTIIASKPDQHVSLTITHMELNMCEMTMYEDYGLKIYSGDDNSAPLLGQFCGTKVPPLQTSAGNMLHIELNNTYLLFTASYSVYGSACGGTLESLNGEFGSPGYPKSYPVDTQCEWLITVAPGSSVTLSFQTFDIVSSSSCNDDYLEVRLGTNIGKLIGIYCGNVVPATATHNQSVWLMFKSGAADVGEEAKTAPGFLAEYALVHGGELYGTEGSIASPMYPRFVSQVDSFFWRITVTSGHAVSLKFTDFYVETIAEEECYLSSIQVYDGYDMQSTLIKSLCGIEIPNEITSSSNVMYIRADLNIIRHGMRFAGTWKQIPIVKTFPTKAKSNVTGCVEINMIDMTELKNFTISSPGYPMGYDSLLDCEWIFETLPGNHLELSLEVVDLESIRSCLTDAITVSSRVSGSWTNMKTVCLSNATETNIEASNAMKIQFHTDAYRNKTGFTGTVYLHCGGQLSGPNGVIQIDNNTFSETSVIDACEWNVTVRSGRTIQVEFKSFDLGSNSENLCQNYILLKNGIYSDSPILGNGKYCGTDKPDILQTTGNNLYIKAKKVPKLAGFVLVYTEMSRTCGGSYRLSKEIPFLEINSPNYPNIPAPHTECKWIVAAPSGESMQVDFEERFDLEQTDDCKVEAVEIRDGGSKMSSLLGRFCGQDVPSTQRSQNNMLYIDFFTDSEDPKNGFKAKISLAKCGGIIRERSGTLQSPYFNDKKSYSEEMNCTWKIVGPRDHFLTLTFKAIDMRPSFAILQANCSKNYVLVKESMKVNNTIIENVLGKFCERTVPDDVITSGNEVVIQYVTQSKNPFQKGFSLFFNASQEACGGELSTNAGVITSPGYPVSNHFQRHCEWIIRVAKGRRITVHIDDFDMDESVNFYSQGAAFFNGEDYKSTIAVLKAGDKTTLFKSSDNVMTIFFWSTRSSGHRGIKISYTSDEQSACPGDFNYQEGIISQPKENMSSYSCTWIREQPNERNETVALSILVGGSSSTEAIKSNCKYAVNSISVSDNKDNAIAQVCTTTKPVIIRSPYPVTKIMVSVSAIQSSEFQEFNITYKAHPCGGIITEPDGVISSPQSRNIDCAWLLKLPEEQSIKLTADTFDLGDDCDLAYLIIYNGASPNSPKINRYCGHNKPQLVQSQDNSLWLEYHAKTSNKDIKGFNLRYETVASGCGGIYYDNSMILQSPNYPKDYPNNAECVWEIHAMNGHHIGLKFLDRFHLEQSDGCTQDFVEIWDMRGNSNDSNRWVSMGKVCGREYPKIFNSTSNRMRIMFRSNSRGVGSGFKAKWSLNCGGKFQATEVIRYITSPGYPQDYPNDLQCIYSITPPKGAFMEILFEDFELEKNTGECTYDSLSIQQVSYLPSFRRVPRELGVYKTVPIKHCGTNKPMPIRTNQEVLLNFTTDSWISRKGFMMSYALDICGGAIDQPTIISTRSKNRPSMVSASPSYLYIQSTSCVWNITAPSDRIVVAKFQSLQLDHITNCAFGALNIYNSFEQTEANRLARLCGNLTENLPTITSTSNKMALSIFGSLSNLSGFIASIYFTPGPSSNCGGNINVKAGIVSLLRLPSLAESIDCSWKYIAPEDHVVRLEFNRSRLAVECFNRTVRHGNNCWCHLYQVRDGAGPFSELVNEFCDETEDMIIITSGRYAWFRMAYSEGQTAGEPPFRMLATAIPSICGTTTLEVTNTTQYLTSPNYPNSYPNNVKCKYILRIPNGTANHIYLNFIDFNLMDVNTSNDLIENICSDDKVQITDAKSSSFVSEGLGPAAIFMGKSLYPVLQQHFRAMPIGTHLFCGQSSVEHHYYSAGDRVMVTFISGDHARHGKGFKMQYRVSYCPPDFTSVQGRVLADRSSGNCTYKIIAPANYTISLYFQQFFFYDFSNCQSVGLSVRDTNNTKPLMRICGYKIPDPIFSISNEIEIHSWNSRNNYLGHYDVIFTTTDQGRGCGGKLYNYAGKFTSPMYPVNSRLMRTCQWDVTIPAGLQLAFKFAEFDIQAPCETDYVTVITYEQNSANSRKFCRNVIPATLLSDRRITVLHTTSVNNAGTGWVAQFIAVTSDTSLKNW